LSHGTNSVCRVPSIESKLDKMTHTRGSARISQEDGQAMVIMEDGDSFSVYCMVSLRYVLENLHTILSVDSGAWPLAFFWLSH